MSSAPAHIKSCSSHAPARAASCQHEMRWIFGVNMCARLHTYALSKDPVNPTAIPQDKDERHESEFKHSTRLYCLHWHPSNPAELVTSADDKYIR